MGKTAIVIVAWNAVELTRRCLASLAASDAAGCPVILVDNGSRDGTADAAKDFAGCGVVSLPANAGAARGKNAGAEAALADPDVTSVCFLDNDTVVPSRWLGPMKELLERDPSVGLVGPLTRAAAAPQNVAAEFPSGDTETVAAAVRGREPERLAAAELCGFCLLVRADALRKVGRFDECFGLCGYEDWDFCRRASAAGWACAVANRAFVEHRGGGTLDANAADWYRILETAALRFGAKWAASPSVSFIRSRPIAAGGEGTVAHPPVSIIILGFNRLDRTRECIDAVRSFTRNDELVFIDNGSTDATADWVRAIDPAIRLFRNRTNVGLVRARNQGIRAARHDHIVLMDNDVVVRDGWLESLFAKLEPGVGLVGAEGWRMQPDGQPVGPLTDPSEPFDYLGGACGLFRREVFERAGLLDEGFSPAYYEDSDLCRRAVAAGFKLAWQAAAPLVHREHSTLMFGTRDFEPKPAMMASRDRYLAKARGDLRVREQLLPPLTGLRRRARDFLVATSGRHAAKRAAPAVVPLFVPPGLAAGERILLPFEVTNPGSRAIDMITWHWFDGAGVALGPATVADLGLAPGMRLEIQVPVRVPNGAGPHRLVARLFDAGSAVVASATLRVDLQ